MKMNWDYIAGFLDGEGCVSCINRKREARDSKYRRALARVDIAQKRPEVLYKIAAFLETQGIICHIYHKRDGAIHYLSIADLRTVKKFLEYVKDKTVVKTPEIEQALKLDYKIRATSLTKQEIADAHKLREQGYSHQDIGEILGRCPSNLRRRLIEVFGYSGKIKKRWFRRVPINERFDSQSI